MSIELPDIGEFLDKVDGLDEFGRMLKAVPKHADDLKGLTKGPLDFMGPIGNAMDAWSVGKGGYNLAEGFTEDGTDANDDIAIVDGIHDILDGGSGLMGEAGGTVGALSKAFNAGFTVGDFIAPYVFNDAAHEGAHTEEIPEDGVFHAETGNESVDEVIEGVRDISEGNYLDGALDIADGATGVLSPIIPGGGVLEMGKDLWEWGSSDD